MAWRTDIDAPFQIGHNAASNGATNPPATINIALETLLSRDVCFLAAVTRYWEYFDGELIRGPMAVSELNFGRLWSQLEDRGFIKDAARKPIPSAIEINAERLRVAADRTIQVDAESDQVPTSIDE